MDGNWKKTIGELVKDATIIDKPTFGSTKLAELIKAISDKEEIEIELVGLYTDICVVSNALLPDSDSLNIQKQPMPEIAMAVFLIFSVYIKKHYPKIKGW